MQNIKRTSKDAEWQAVKEKVYKRDTKCRLSMVLTPQEYMVLKKHAGNMLEQLDPAHYHSVSSRPDLCYKSYNIVALNHYSHSNLDSFKHPLDGSEITSEEVDWWWERILKGNPVQYQYLLSKDLIRRSGIK